MWTGCDRAFDSLIDRLAIGVTFLQRNSNGDNVGEYFFSQNTIGFDQRWPTDLYLLDICKWSDKSEGPLSILSASQSYKCVHAVNHSVNLTNETGNLQVQWMFIHWESDEFKLKWKIDTSTSFPGRKVAILQIQLANESNRWIRLPNWKFQSWMAWLSKSHQVEISKYDVTVNQLVARTT